MGTTSSKLAVVGGVTAAAVVAGGVYIATRSSTGDDVASSVPADMPASSTTAAADDAVPAGGVAATDETVCVDGDSTPANGPATGHPVAEPVPVPPVDGSALSESPSAAPTTAPTAVTSNAAVSSDDNSGSKVGNHAPVPSLTPQGSVSASSPVRVGPGTPAETAPEPTPAVATVTPKGKSASNAPTCPIEGTQDEDTPSPAPAKAFVPPEIDSEDEYDANTAVSSSFLPDMMTESAGVSIGEFATANAYLAEQVTKLGLAVCRIESHVHPHLAGTGVVVARHESEIAVMTTVDALPDSVSGCSARLVFVASDITTEINTDQTATVFHRGRIAFLLCSAPDDTLVPVSFVPVGSDPDTSHEPVSVVTHFGGSRRQRVSVAKVSSEGVVADVRPGASGAPVVKFVGLTNRTLPWCQGVVSAVGSSLSLDRLVTGTSLVACRKDALRLKRVLSRMLVMRSYAISGRSTLKETVPKLIASASDVAMVAAPLVGPPAGMSTSAESRLLATLRV